MFAAMAPLGATCAEDMIERFEEALFRGENPAIDQFLPDIAEHRQATLIELAQIELEYKLKAGQPARAENYFQRYPELGRDRNAAVDLIVSEFALRSRVEADLAPDSYLQRFSKFGDELAARLEAIQDDRASISGLSANRVSRANEKPEPTTTAMKVLPPPSSSFLSHVTSQFVAEEAEHAPSDVVPALDPPPIPEIAQIRDYRIIDRIGGGGMGIVYKATHEHLCRTVAIKVLSPRLTAEPHALARFKQEMQAVGRLDHPNIVRATDAGEVGGRHFLVMEYVDGPTLTDIAKQAGPLNAADACELIRQAAEALEHVHQAGLVHRDIKPSNLMLTRQGQIKLLDLGLAKLHTRDDEKADLTSAGDMMGTLDYMAREQVDDSSGVDIRADIYSLGCTLYQLLCGQPPLFHPDRKTVTQKLAALASESAPPIQMWRADLPPGLATVVNRMVSPSRAGRQQTPAVVSEELAPFAAGCNLPALLRKVDQSPTQPHVDPSRASTFDHVTSAVIDTQLSIDAVARQSKPAIASWAVVRRYRWPLAMSALLLLVVVAVVFGAWGKSARRPSPLDPPAETATIDTSLGSLALVSRPAKIEGVESWTIETIGHRGDISTAVFSPDGSWLASYGADGTIRVWDAKSGQLARALVGQGTPTHNGQGAPTTHCLAWSPDNQSLAAACNSQTHPSVYLWDVKAGQLKKTLDVKMGLSTVAFSPDGKTLATGHGNTVRLWKIDSGEMLDLLEAEKGQASALSNEALAWAPDGSKIASLVSPGLVHVWEVKTASLFRTLPMGEGARGIAWSANSERLAASGEPAKIFEIKSGKAIEAGVTTGPVLWLDHDRLVAFGRNLHDATTGKLVRSVPNAGVAIRSWSPNGKSFASHDGLGNLSVCDGTTGKLLITHPGNPGRPAIAAWSHDGKRLAALGGIWNLATASVVQPYPEDCFPIAFSPDDRFMSMVVPGSVAQVMDLESAQFWPYQLSALFLGYASNCSQRVVWARDGMSMLGATPDGLVTLIDLRTNKAIVTFDKEVKNLSSLAWSPDEKWVAASAEVTSKLVLWDARTGKRIRDLGADGTVMFPQWSPDSQRIAGCIDAIGNGRRQVVIWDPATGQKTRTIDIPPVDTSFIALRWTADGKQLVVGSGNGRYWWYDVASGKLERERAAPHGNYLSPDATKILVSWGPDSRLRMWDIMEGRSIADLVHFGNQTNMVISADGHYRGSPGAARQIVYVVKTSQGQETMSPDEFANRFGWHNDPDNVRLASP